MATCESNLNSLLVLTLDGGPNDLHLFTLSFAGHAI
jgi:hypothetical protein